MGLCEEYRLFHSYMRRFDLLPSLVDVWRYSLHVTERRPLPDDYAIGQSARTLKPLNELPFPWELDILSRELVLNATRRGTRSLKNWNDLAVAVDHIRRLDDIAFTSNGGPLGAISAPSARAARRAPADGG